MSLTPAQQAALEQFEADAASAATAATDNDAAQLAMYTAEAAASQAATAALEAHAVALASAQAFIDILVQDTAPPSPSAVPAAKK